MTSPNPAPVERDPSGNFLLALRQATAPLHERLDQSPLSTALLRDDVALNDYTAYLKKTEAIVRFSDDALLPILQPVLPDAGERKKLGWLLSDLTYFRIEAAAETQSFQPFVPADAATAFGFFYVVEGSTLGGRVLLKHLQPRLATDADAGGRFFYGYGTETSAYWKSFLTAFSEYALANGCEDEIINAAQQAFGAIHRHFNS